MTLLITRKRVHKELTLKKEKKDEEMIKKTAKKGIIEYIHN